jgi:riboflavin kinase / FMN adenylyltransferase
MLQMIKLTGLPKKPIHSLGIGVFDGLHLGHHELVKHCDALLSFHPHPDLVLKKETDLKLITTKKELRIHHKNTLFLNFTKAIAALKPDDFLTSIIKEIINPKHIVVGYDFHYGFKKQGSPEHLKQWGKKNGISVTVIPPFTIDNVPVKSGLIRRCLKDNKFDQAVRYLGHPFTIIGKVIKGEGRGRLLGYPTANLKVSSLKLLPTNGVYLGEVMLKKRRLPAMVYIGNKPTFNGNSSTVEVHIPHFNESLYDTYLHVGLTKKVRDEHTFKSKDELISQIQKDLICIA